MDCAPPLCQNADMHATSLSSMRNLGPRSRQMLAAIGILTPEQLAERGAVEAFIALKRACQPISLNLLWAMEGALSGRDWRVVARDDRLHLLSELEARGVRP